MSHKNHNNLSGDPSILDIEIISGIDCEGDERTTLITMTFNIGEDCYVIEQFLDGDLQECDSFSNRDDAEWDMSVKVRDTKAHYASEFRSYQRGLDA